MALGDSQTSGALTGGGGLALDGGGTLILSPGATYTGPTTITDGSIVITEPSALGLDASPVVVRGSNPTIGQATNIRGFGGGSLVLNGLSSGFSLSRALSLQGQGPIADRGAALISMGDNTLSGLVTTNELKAGTTTNINTQIFSALGTLSFAGGLLVQGANGGAGGAVSSTVLTLGATNQAGVSNYVISGPLSGGGVLSRSGGGTLFLSPSDVSAFNGSIRTGGVSALGQSTVRITQPNVLGTRTASGLNAVIDLFGGTLEVLMDSPALLQGGGTPANVVGRASSSIFVDKGVGSLAAGGTLSLGQFTPFSNATINFNSRNGYGIAFNTAHASQDPPSR